MFISIEALEGRNLEFQEEFQPQDIDLGPELAAQQPLLTRGRAELVEEHRGHKQIIQDIRLVGSYSTQVELRCARCLEPVVRRLAADFDLLYRPLGADARAAEASIHEAETEIGYYSGPGLLLEDVLKEQILLAVPVKTVCREECLGLCSQCGRNRNLGACGCAQPLADPRWQALKELKGKLPS